MSALKKRKFIIIAVVILVIAIVLSSFVYLNFQKPYAGPIESIILGTTFLESVSPGFVAEDQHFFTHNGLNVTLNIMTLG